MRIGAIARGWTGSQLVGNDSDVTGCGRGHTYFMKIWRTLTWLARQSAILAGRPTVATAALARPARRLIKRSYGKHVLIENRYYPGLDCNSDVCGNC